MERAFSQRPFGQRLIGLYLPGLVVAVSAAAYLGTISTTVYWGDGTELAGAGRVLGIAHPTGYPLYTMMLHAAECLPVGTVAFRANLLSAVLAVLTALVWYHIGLCVTARLRERTGGRWFGSELERGAVAVCLALTIVLSRAFWFYAITTQSYILNMLFLAAGALWSFRLAERFTLRRWAALWLLWGLALANHRLSLSLLPMILICGLRGISNLKSQIPDLPRGAPPTNDDSRSAIRDPRPTIHDPQSTIHDSRSTNHEFRHSLLAKALLIPLIAALGLAAYAYLPIRAAKNPPQNWGNPNNLERFLWSARGGQFTEFMFLHIDPSRPFTLETYMPWAQRRISHLANWSMTQTGWEEGWAGGAGQDGQNGQDGHIGRGGRLRVAALTGLLFFAAAGAWLWLRADLWLAAAAAGACAVNLAVVFSYNIPNMGGYFLPLFPWGVLAVLLVAARLARWIESQYFAGRRAGLAWACLLVPVAMFGTNGTYMTYVKTAAPWEYGRCLLGGVEPYALVLTEGDSAIYSPWYQQNVERFRTDVAVVGANFIAGSPWYREYFRGCHSFVLDFPFADAVLPSEEAYNRLWSDGILKPQLARGRPIYTTFDASQRPFLIPFKPKPAGDLLRYPEDYEVPEGHPKVEQIARDSWGRPVIYMDCPDGGIMPRPPYASRLSAPD